MVKMEVVQEFYTNKIQPRLHDKERVLKEAKRFIQTHCRNIRVSNSEEHDLIKNFIENPTFQEFVLMLRLL